MSEVNTLQLAAEFDAWQASQGMGQSISAAVEAHHLALRAAQREFGLARLKIGLVLANVEDRGLWRGKADSMRDYLEEERINPAAARQYTRVARKLIVELALSDADLEELAGVNMSTLDKACKLLNQDNRDEIIAIVTSLSEHDAKHELDLMVMPEETKRKQNPKVRTLLGQFRALPHELRVEVMTSLGLHHGIAARRPETHERSPERDA